MKLHMWLRGVDKLLWGPRGSLRDPLRSKSCKVAMARYPYLRQGQGITGEDSRNIEFGYACSRTGISEEKCH